MDSINTSLSLRSRTPFYVNIAREPSKNTLPIMVKVVGLLLEHGSYGWQLDLLVPPGADTEGLTNWYKNGQDWLRQASGGTRLPASLYKRKLVLVALDQLFKLHGVFVRDHLTEADGSSRWTLSIDTVEVDGDELPGDRLGHPT